MSMEEETNTESNAPLWKGKWSSAEWAQQRTTAPEALRIFLCMVDTVQGPGLFLIILVSFPCICWDVIPALEEKTCQYKVSFQDVRCCIVGISKLQDGTKIKQKEAEQVIIAFDKKSLLVLHGNVITHSRAILPEELCKHYIERNPGRSSA